MSTSSSSQEKAPWITYRPELKVLDCTVRDGGLINDHQFSDEFVRAVYDTCIAAGVDTMEIGYKNSERLFPKDRFGAWRHCDEHDMRRVVGDHDAESPPACHLSLHLGNRPGRIPFGPERLPLMHHLAEGCARIDPDRSFSDGHGPSRVPAKRAGQRERG